VREIHVDFLLEEEFNVSPSFLEHFIKRARKDQGGPFSKESVKRSVSDPFGEADLVVVYKQSEGDAKRIAILIEDKIGAEFQPSQAERYRKRGELGKGREWDDYWTCLVAPESYIGEGSADGFDAEIGLEEINEWIAASEPARRAFKVEVIQEAIRKANWLGPQEVDALWVPRERLGQNLDGHVAEPGIPRPVHFSHAASAQRSKDFIWTKFERFKGACTD